MNVLIMMILTSKFNYDSWAGNLDEHHYKFIRNVVLSSKWVVKDEETQHERRKRKTRPYA